MRAGDGAASVAARTEWLNRSLSAGQRPVRASVPDHARAAPRCGRSGRPAGRSGRARAGAGSSARSASSATGAGPSRRRDTPGAGHDERHVAVVGGVAAVLGDLLDLAGVDDAVLRDADQVRGVACRRPARRPERSAAAPV